MSFLIGSAIQQAMDKDINKISFYTSVAKPSDALSRHILIHGDHRRQFPIMHSKPKKYIRLGSIGINRLIWSLDLQYICHDKKTFMTLSFDFVSFAEA